jgi:hypothetical protein
MNSSDKSIQTVNDVILSHIISIWVNYIRLHHLTRRVKQIPICIQDFKTVRSEDCYFADKSMLIGQMPNQSENGVFPYTEMCCFGKSVNLSNKQVVIGCMSGFI